MTPCKGRSKATSSYFCPYRARRLYYAETPGCRFACPGLWITLGLQPALAKSETSVIYKRSKTKNRYLYPFYHTTTTYTPSILHLTQTHYNSLTINTLLSVRCYQRHLHASYTTYMLPRGTSTGGRHYGIGGQKSLLLRQIFLRPSGV